MQMKAKAVVRVAATPSSPGPAGRPQGVFYLSRDGGIAHTFCGEASPSRAAATASFRP
jgi:hypothetical protein